MCLRLGFVALLLALCGCREARQEQPPAPALRCSQPSHDFGARVEGDRLVHAFRLENRGDAPVRVLSVEKSYSCAATHFSSPIAPKASALLEISCDMSKRPGRMADEVVVRSNDPNAPNLKLTLTAEVEPLLAFEPSEAVLEPAFGETVTRELRLVGKLAPRARLTLIDSEDPTPRLDLLAPTEKDPVRLKVTLTATRVETRVSRVRVATALSEPKELSVLVTWRVAGNLEIEPSNPYFNLREPPPHERTLHVKSRRGALQVHAVEVAEGPFVAHFERDPTSGGYAIQVRVLDERVPPGERGALGKLLIASDDPAEPRKLVPLFALGVMAKQ